MPFRVPDIRSNLSPIKRVVPQKSQEVPTLPVKVDVNPKNDEAGAKEERAIRVRLEKAVSREYNEKGKYTKKIQEKRAEIRQVEKEAEEEAVKTEKIAQQKAEAYAENQYRKQMGINLIDIFA